MKKQADGLIDLPTQWDNPIATKQTIMSDDRDFSRPRSSYMDISNVPADILQGGTSDILQAIDDPAIKPAQSDNIKQFQIFFGQQPTGIVDDKLISAAKAAEDKISKAVNNPGAHGLLWSDSSKTFKTSVSDLQEALKKIKQLGSAKQAAIISKMPRIQELQKILNKI